ncbi:MAG: hypothetical protein MJY45_04030 [Bacteroidales bacterium]|nr:hypothetical protein [Bacteroidales bacterium]
MFAFEDTTAMPVCGRTGAEDFRLCASSAEILSGLFNGGNGVCVKRECLEFFQMTHGTHREYEAFVGEFPDV